MKKPELLAPAGSMEKLKTALYFGADAVYVGGKNFSLRAGARNFTDEELKEGVEYAHALGKKVYVAVNIFARESDLLPASQYFQYLQSIGADAVIVTDPGLIAVARESAPQLPLHLSTQANTLNSAAVRFWKSQGVSRVILARELSLDTVAEIYKKADGVELEAFVHGAMCISYSGRCLLSNYLNGRDSNRGECVQACRWKYEMREFNRGGEYLTVEEDERGTYVLNSKDLNMIRRIDQLASSGVQSFKIEGRMKSVYYLATVVNAYRRAIDDWAQRGKEYLNNPLYEKELSETAHRAYTEAYAFGDNAETVNYTDAQTDGESDFIAVVVNGTTDGKATVEMRGRFFVGDELEVLSPTDAFLKKITVREMCDEKGNSITDAKLVQQRLVLSTAVSLSAGDILRRKKSAK